MNLQDELPCEACGKPCEELQPCTWDSGLQVGECCQIHSDELPDDEPLCATLYSEVMRARTVQQVCDAFDAHEKSGCPICQGRGKEISGQIEPKQERRAA